METRAAAPAAVLRCCVLRVIHVAYTYSFSFSFFFKSDKTADYRRALPPRVSVHRGDLCAGWCCFFVFCGLVCRRFFPLFGPFLTKPRSCNANKSPRVAINIQESSTGDTGGCGMWDGGWNTTRKNRSYVPRTQFIVCLVAVASRRVHMVPGLARACLSLSACRTNISKI